MKNNAGIKYKCRNCGRITHGDPVPPERCPECWRLGTLLPEKSERAGVGCAALVGDDAAEALAKRFHETYERLAPSFGYETRKDSAVPWEKVPEKNKALMRAVCFELLSPTKQISNLGKEHEK